MSYLSFKDKVYIVTGAGSGMGRVTANLLAERGAKLGLIDLKISDEVVAEIEAHGGKVVCCICDITSTEQVEGATAKIAKELGKLDGKLSAVRETSIELVLPCTLLALSCWLKFWLIRR